jgi:hypothetical protein
LSAVARQRDGGSFYFIVKRRALRLSDDR